MNDDLPSKTSGQTNDNEAEANQGLDQLQLQIAELRASYSGPLPPSAAFRSYEEVMPGAAKDIMEMAQQEQKHRMNWEITYLNAEIANQQHGQMFGLLAAVLCIGGTVFLGYVGEVWPAVVLAGASMIGVVRAFIGRNK